MLKFLSSQYFAILVVTFTFVCSSSFEVKNCTDTDSNCEKECCSNETDGRMVVCYFTDWAWYRSGIGKYAPENINPSLCTHINYAFSSLDSASLTIKPSDSWADIDNKFYEKVVSLVAKGVKVLLSIGGWNDSTSKWSRMFDNPGSRTKFIESVVKFLDLHKFSGLDVDMEYPGCPQGNKAAGGPNDAKNFNELMREMKAAFNGRYLLTVTVPAGQYNLNECYSMNELCSIPDWINIMAYDYHSSSEGVVGANAPMSGTGSSWGVVQSLEFLTNTVKCPANRMVLGVPFYGHSYTLVNPSEHNFGAKTSGPGAAGMYTKSPGTLAYYEICLNEKSGWQTGWSDINDSYAWNGTQLVAFDNEKDLENKCSLINKYGLLGAMVWTLDFDDFTNACGRGAYPLLTTLNKHLRCSTVCR